MKIFLTVFITVFLAELGDKTQLATLLFATDKAVGKWLVFFAASAALVCTTAIGVVAGDALARLINPLYLQRIAAIGFLAIGAWMLAKSWL